MKRLLLLLALLISPAAFAAYPGAHFISPAFINAGSYTTSSVNTTANSGSEFVVFVFQNTATAVTVTDSKSNSYSLVTLGSGTNPIHDTNDGLYESAFACTSSCVGSTTGMTFSASGGGGLLLMEVAEVPNATAIDVAASAYNSATGTTLSYSVTPTVAGDTILSNASSGGGATTVVPAGSGWTALDAVSSTYAMGSGYLTSATTSAQNAIMTQGHSGWGFIGFTVAFKVSGGGATCTNSGKTSGGALTVPTAGSTVVSLKAGTLGTVDCSTTQYLQPTVGNFGTS